jgi:hypothetical protein
MSAVENVRQLPPTPHDLADQFIADAVDSGGDTDTATAAFLKGMKGRYRGLLDAALAELFEFYMDGKTPKARKNLIPSAIPTDLEKEAQKLERQARRIRLAGQVDAAAEKRLIMKIIMPNGERLGHCTLDYVARVGGAFVKIGKLRDQRLVEQVYTERQLEKAKIA